MTIIITSLWLAKIILKGKIEFSTTPLDIPLLFFVLANSISTYFSIDYHLSIFGYYSRFNGGVISTICYALLYFAFTNNIKKEKIISFIKIIFFSGIIISAYAILQKAGIDKDIWVQDVQNRVFSTLGQPNWLAAWMVLIIPLSLAYSLNKNPKTIFFSLIYFLVLLFTKSRSGILGFLAAEFIFWISVIILQKENQKARKTAVIFNLLIILLVILIGTPWTKSIKDLNTKTEKIEAVGPALETGGTESGEIRKIVWKGALKIWRDYPIFGTGPETFALSYFKYKPQEHNLISEWDFVYNKAHNEFLNYLANTGIIGLSGYLAIIIVTIIQASKIIFRKNKNEDRNYIIGIISGYIGFLVTNIFGFSVVATSFLFFIYPALIFKLTIPEKNEENKEKKQNKIALLFPALIAIILVFQVFKYWKADFYYNKAKTQNLAKNYKIAENYILEARKLNSKEPIYADELARIRFGIALDAYNKNNKELTEEMANLALDEIKKVISDFPNNISLRKTYSSFLIQLSIIDPKLTSDAENSLLTLIQFAPNDAKIYYNLGLLYLRSGNLDKGKNSLEKSVNLKENYRDARLALATAYYKLNEKEKARYQLEYILKKINPNDEDAKIRLEELN